MNDNNNINNQKRQRESGVEPSPKRPQGAFGSPPPAEPDWIGGGGASSSTLPLPPSSEGPARTSENQDAYPFAATIALKEQVGSTVPPNIAESAPLSASAIGIASFTSGEPRDTTHSIRAYLGIGDSNAVFNAAQCTLRLHQVVPKDVVEAVVEDFGEVGTEALKARVTKWKHGPPAELNSELALMIESSMKNWWDAAQLSQDAAQLSLYGIETIPEFARSAVLAKTIVSAITYHRLEAKMLQLAEEEKMLQLAEEEKMRASWNEFAGKLVIDRRASTSPFLLARPFEEGKVSRFMGSDREAVVDDVVRYIRECSSKEKAMKEANPIHVVFGAPRMGKSRVLDEVCSKVNNMGDCLAIPITFNSTTVLIKPVGYVTEATIRHEWFSRLVYSLYCMFCHTTLSFAFFYNMPEWQYVTLGDVLSLAIRLSQKKHVTIVADEASRFFDLPRCEKDLIQSVLLNPLWMNGNFALVVSGFVSSTVSIVGTLSGHPTSSNQLFPISNGTADSYKDLRSAARRVTSFELYQCIRFCPGLMGLAIEVCGGKVLHCLEPPVVMAIRDNYDQLFSGYWEHVANAQTFDDAVLISQKGQSGLDKCEASGIVLHEPGSGFRAILNPFFLICFNLDVPSLSPLQAFRESLKKWATAQHDMALKGAVLETLLVGALRLRAFYMAPMNASKFFELICGHKSSLDNEWLVSFEGANLGATVTSFPHHDESSDDKSRRSPVDIEKSKSAVEGLISSGGFVAQMSAKYNMGCDVVAVGSYISDDNVRGKCCLMFETRFWNQDFPCKAGSKNEATRKASLALLGVFNNYPNTFKRVSFVYLTTCTIKEDAINYNCHVPFYAGGSSHTVSIAELISKLKERDCIATVDVVHCLGGNHDPSNTFRNIMMQSLTYFVPSFELNTAD